jgi:hypothetical protein
MKFLPHRKHSESRLTTNPLMLFRETVAVNEHTIHSVGRIQSFDILKQVVHIITTGL